MYYREDDVTYFESVFHPTYIIDSVWKLLITFTEAYKEYWIELCGGIIERTDPNEEQTNEQHNSFSMLLISTDAFLSKYKPIWQHVPLFINW